MSMKNPAIFAQHFSRMVWLAARTPEGRSDDLDYAARAAEALLRVGGATLSSRDWRLLVEGEPMPHALSGVPDLALAARLVGHSVSSIQFDSFAPRDELIAMALALATEPVAGDSGRGIAAMVQPVVMHRVHLQVTGTPSPLSVATLERDLESMRRRYSTPADLSPRSTPPASPPVSSTATPAGGAGVPSALHGAHTPSRGIDARTEVRAAVQLETVDNKIFEALDEASRRGTLARVMDDMVRQAETAALKDDTQTVFVIMYAIVSREASARVGGARTPYVIVAKRLVKRALVRALARHLSTHRELEDQILQIFGRLGDDGAVMLVEELADAENRSERRAFFDILSRLKSGHVALQHSLSDPRWFVVRNAAELMGQMQADGTAHELAKLLAHPDERVRRAATISLGQLSSEKDTMQPLLTALADSSPFVRSAAAMVLGSRRNARALDAMLALHEREDDEGVQIALLDALGRNGTPSAVKRIAESSEPAGILSKRKSSAYRSAAAAVLRKIDTAASRAALEKLRQDKDPAVRAAAGG
jgi:HEAT repeat protein